MLTRAGPRILGNVARGLELLPPGAHAGGQRCQDRGVDSLARRVGAVLPTRRPASARRTGASFWLRRPAAPADGGGRWAAAAAPAANLEGFVTAPGMFSPERRRSGQPAAGRGVRRPAGGGRVADLGAGWGWLARAGARRARRRSARLDLYEAEALALDAARANLGNDPRASFHWTDVTGLGSGAPPYDAVIANPPFHQGRAAEPDLGAAFIVAAARILKPTGRLLMVANRQLPYEAALDARFRHWEKLSEDGAYKVIPPSGRAPVTGPLAGPARAGRAPARRDPDGARMNRRQHVTIGTWYRKARPADAQPRVTSRPASRQPAHGRGAAGDHHLPRGRARHRPDAAARHPQRHPPARGADGRGRRPRPSVHRRAGGQPRPRRPAGARASSRPPRGSAASTATPGAPRRWPGTPPSSRWPTPSTRWPSRVPPGGRTATGDRQEDPHDRPGRPDRRADPLPLGHPGRGRRDRAARARMLAAAGFRTRRADRNGIANLFARWGTAGPVLGFNGHTDVVPPGDPAAWRHDPFAGVIDNGTLYGRGAADMKSGVAAFVAAAIDFVAATPPAGSVVAGHHRRRGGRRASTAPVAILDWMAANGERMDHCLVGEPTCPARMGEMIKIGRRGALTARLTAYGLQGHSAYPERARNPLPALVRLLDRLASPPARRGHRALRSLDAGDHHHRHRQPGLERHPGRGARDRQHPLQRRPCRRRACRDWIEEEADAGGGRVRRRHRRPRPGLGRELPDRARPVHRRWSRGAVAAETGVDAGAFDLGRHLGRALHQGPLPGGRVRAGRRHHAPDRRARRDRGHPPAQGDLRPHPRRLLRGRGLKDSTG